MQLKLHADGKRWGLQSGIHLKSVETIGWTAGKWVSRRMPRNRLSLQSGCAAATFANTLCVLRLITPSEEER